MFKNDGSNEKRFNLLAFALPMRRMTVAIESPSRPSLVAFDRCSLLPEPH